MPIPAARHRACAVALALTAAGCNEVDPHAYVDAVAWSDDELEVAYTVQRFDSVYPKRNPREDHNENYRFELWTSAPDGADARLLREGDGHPGALFYMRSAGYLAFETSDEDGDDHVLEAIRLDGETMLELDGRERPEICEGCRATDWVPSPDGSMIAVQYTGLYGPDGHLAMVHEIVRADDGSRLAGPFALDRPSGWAFWTSDGDFMIRVEDGAALRWTPGASELTEVDLPDCHPPLAPQTTSSFVASDGRMLCGIRDVDEPVECECHYAEGHVPAVECDRPALADDERLVPFGCP